MEIILLQDIEKLGNQFDTVTVKPGYGRNYLIPQKLAVIANKANKANVGERIRQIKFKENRVMQQIESMIDRIKANPIIIGAKVGTTDKIFGSVTNVQLADAIKKQTGIEVDRRKIIIKEEVKVLGSYEAEIKFSEEAKYNFTFEVVSE